MKYHAQNDNLFEWFGFLYQEGGVEGDSIFDFMYWYFCWFFLVVDTYMALYHVFWLTKPHKFLYDDHIPGNERRRYSILDLVLILLLIILVNYMFMDNYYILYFDLQNLIKSDLIQKLNIMTYKGPQGLYNWPTSCSCTTKVIGINYTYRIGYYSIQFNSIQFNSIQFNSIQWILSILSVKQYCFHTYHTICKIRK